jgi:hypothetical protein
VGDPDDWYADYVDWLIANQTNATMSGGGNWAPLGFSCCQTTQDLSSAIAELILSPVALIQPDPIKFSSVGLRHGNPLVTTPLTNPVGTSHTVTAIAESDTGTPVPGATINFSVISGPNAGKSGSSVTGANGQTTFTYQDTGGPAGGTDKIQASLGQLQSNILDKIWVSAAVPRCDTNNDQVVNAADLAAIRAALGTAASSPTDPKDGNGDMVINIADLRYCQLRLGPLP